MQPSTPSRKSVGLSGQAAHVKGQKTTKDAKRRNEGSSVDGGKVTNSHVLTSKIRRGK